MICCTANREAKALRISNIFVAAIALISLGACSERAQSQAESAGDDAAAAAKQAGDGTETKVKDAAADIEDAADTATRKADAAGEAAKKTD